MAHNEKIERPTFQPRFFDREQIEAAQQLLREAEADLQYLANPVVRGSAGNGGAAVARLLRDGTQYAALVRSLRNAVNHPYFGCFQSLRAQRANVEKMRRILAKDYQAVKGANESVIFNGRTIAMRRLPDPGAGPDPKNQKVGYNGKEFFVNASDLQWIDQHGRITFSSPTDGRTITASRFGMGEFNQRYQISGQSYYFNRDQVSKEYHLRNGGHFRYSLLPLEPKQGGLRRVYLAIGGRNAEPVFVKSEDANKYFDAAGGLNPQWS